MKGSALLLLLAIADFADDDGVAFPGTSTLAEKIRMSERQVVRLRQMLYESGELEYIGGGNGAGDRLTVRVTTCQKGDNLSQKGDKSGKKRVTNSPRKGDKSGKKRVTPMSPEPPVEPPIESPIRNTTTTTSGGGDDVESDGGGATLAQVNKAYENEIGMFTAMMSETVGDDFDTYGGDWLIDAIKIAANSNKRSWRYVQGILRRWSIEGRGDLDAKANNGAQTFIICADGVARPFVVAPEYMQDGQIAPNVEPVQVGDAWVLHEVPA
jgi:DnaD/phage-associated family protein